MICCLSACARLAWAGSRANRPSLIGLKRNPVLKLSESSMFKQPWLLDGQMRATWYLANNFEVLCAVARYVMLATGVPAGFIAPDQAVK